MRPIALIAVREFTDAGGSYVRGEYLERSAVAAVILLNHRHVRLAKRGDTPPPLPRRHVIETDRDVPVDVEPQAVDDEFVTPRRRTYRRRDLTAEQP